MIVTIEKRHRQIVLRRNTYLASASRFGRELPLEECSHSTESALWVALGFGLLPVAVVTADSWERAWEAMLDALPAVPVEDLHEAYGCTEEEWAAHHAAADTLVAECGVTARGDYAWPDLAEGYSYQPNAGGSTGIVDTDHVTLVPLTPDVLARLDMELTVEAPS